MFWRVREGGKVQPETRESFIEGSNLCLTIAFMEFPEPLCYVDLTPCYKEELRHRDIHTIAHNQISTEFSSSSHIAQLNLDLPRETFPEPLDKVKSLWYTIS